MKLSVTDTYLKQNRPLYLDQHDHFWLIVSGEVEVFCIEKDTDGNLIGARQYMYTASKGEMLFSMRHAETKSNITLFAISENAKLLQINKSSIKNVESSDLSVRIEKWIDKCSSFCSETIYPRDYINLADKTECQLKKGQIAYPAEGLYWVECKEGDLNIYGQSKRLEDQTIKNNLLPVIGSLYIQANKQSDLNIYSTSDVVEDEITLMFAVEHLQAHFLECLSSKLAENKAKFESGFHKKNFSDSELLESSLHSLKSIVTDDPNEKVFKDISNSNDVLAACQVIGNLVGFTFKEPKYIDDNHKGLTSQLHEIAKVSNVRLRKVILRGKWWNEENGHLFAFIKESEKAVALVQKRGGGYLLKDPETKEIVEVDEEVSATLDPVSYMFLYSFDQKMTTVAKLWNFAIKGLKKDAIWILVASLAGSLIGLIIPIVTGIMYDDVIPQADESFLFEVVGILVLIAIVNAFLGFIKGILLLRVETQSNLTIQAGLMDHLLRLPVNFFKQYTAGDLTMRALGINTIRQIISGVVMTAVLSGAFSIVNLGLLFYYDVKLALVGVALSAIAVIFVVSMGLLKLRYDRQISDQHGEIQGLLYEFLSGISKVRIAGTEKRFFALWASKFGQFKLLGFKSGNLQNFVEVFNSTFPLVTNILFFGFIYYALTTASAAGAGVISVGIFMAFISAFSQFLSDCLSMSHAVISSLNMVPLYERVKPILEEEPETHLDSIDPGELTGDIEMNSVSFRYNEDQPLVLEDVSFKINAGEMVAFVGPSGSGKSTVMRLLLGFEEPEAGSIFFDGQSFETLNKEMVRRQTGVVLQSGSLMSGSIFNNIVGNSELTLEQATEAANMAGLEEDIKHMPMGMHTVISDGASTFSGGQRQRLMIARAIVHKPRMLLMDEATSALDNRTQTIVSQSLDKLQATRIIIAHRLSTVMNADRIYVMDQGKIIEHGSYNELMQKDGLFSTLAKRQIA